MELRFSFGLSLGQIAFCAVLCQDLGLYLWLEGKINLWGAVGVSLFRVWLTWEETPCQVRDCCKYLSVEGYHKESFFFYKGIPSGICPDVQSLADWVDSSGDLSQ